MAAAKAEARVAAALHAAKYQEALDLCGDGARFAFLKAYALYRLDRLADVLPLLDAAGEAAPQPASLHLRAQILYRLGRYSECVPLYEHELARLRAEEGGGGADEEASADVLDAQLNLAACLVSAGQGEAMLRHPELVGVVAAVLGGRVLQRDLPYELTFNVACALLDAGRPAEAARGLEQALAVGTRFLEGSSSGDDATGASSSSLSAAPLAPETLRELAAVRAQAALLLQAAHYDDAAAAVYVQLGGGHGGNGGAGAGADAATMAVVANNRAQLFKSSREAIEALKRIRQALAGAAAAKLTRRQVLTLQLNRALLLLQQRKLDDCGLALAELGAALRAEPAQAHYVRVLIEHASAAEASLRHQRALLARDSVPRAAAADTATDLEARLASMHSPATASASYPASLLAPPLSPVAGALAQLLVSEGRLLEAASRLASPTQTAGAGAQGVVPPLHPARAATQAQLLLLASRAAAAEGDAAAAAAAQAQAQAVLDTCVSGWQGKAAAEAVASPLSLAAGAGTGHVSLMAAQALYTRAGFFAGLGLTRLPAAVADFEVVAKLPLGAGHRGAALACTALLRVQQAGAARGDEAAQLEATAERLLAEASSAAASSGLGGAAADAALAGGGKGASAEERAAAQRRLDLLEFPPSAGAASSGGTAKAAALAAAAAVGASTAAAAPTPADVARIARRAEVKRAKAKKRRAKRREKYLAALRASGKYALVGLPPPQADRWLPRRERERLRKGGSRGKPAKGSTYVGAGAHQGGSDAQAEKMLDTRARVEAAAATKAAAAAAQAASAAKGKGGGAAAAAAAAALKKDADKDSADKAAAAKAAAAAASATHTKGKKGR